MRWTLGLACFVTACFGEGASSSSTSDDDTTSSAPTTTDPTNETTSSTNASTTASTDDTETSDPSDATETSGVDTTAGDTCGMGTVPNPPSPPPGWSVVFVSPSTATPLGCPGGTDPLAIGHVGIGATVDECGCFCDEPFDDLCTVEYTPSDFCPSNGGALQIDSACDPVAPNQRGFLGQAFGSVCDPDPVIPPSEGRVHICAAEESTDACIEQPMEFVGPCLFRPGFFDCPMDAGLQELDVGRVPSCGQCAEDCPIAAYCGSARFEVFSGADCTNELVAFNDEACHETMEDAGSIRAVPLLEQACGTTQLVLDELTVCCPM